MPAMILGPRVIVQCQNTALTNSLANIGDGVAGLSAIAGEALEVVSSSANDAAAGTGARTVTIIYLNPSGAVLSETVTLNGTSAVATVATNIWRILDMWCASFGSGGTNAGTITLRVVSAAGNRLSIPLLRLRAAPGQFTVPAGYTFFLHGAFFSSSVASATTPLQISYQIEAELSPANGSYTTGVWSPVLKSTGGLYRPCNLTIPGSKFGIQIPGLATIRARAIVATAVTVEVGGQFWGALVKDGDYHKSSGPDPDLVWK